MGAQAESRWSLWFDLWSGKVLAWVATAGRDAELTPEAHLFFFDRFDRLARLYRRQGRLGRANRLEEKADEHYRAAGGPPRGDPPRAAAMAMPRPRQYVRTDAVSRVRLDPPDDAA